MDPAVADFAAHALARIEAPATPSPAVAELLAAEGARPAVADPSGLPDHAVDALALLDDELSLAGAHAEGLIAEAARVLRPGGTLAAAGRSARHAEARGDPAGLRTFTAAELTRLLGHAGFHVTGVWAPGAAAALGGVEGRFDPDRDRTPGLLDAARHVAVTATRHADEAARSRAFFGSLPLKVVAAAVVCRDPEGRLLCVYDSFKRHWTVPGGVVDADEDPRQGAARETREEAGVDVEVGRLLGLFAMSWPDRLLLVYDARPVGDPTPRPVHAHEIGAAEWLELDAALERLNARTAEHVRRCLDAPGGSWQG